MVAIAPGLPPAAHICSPFHHVPKQNPPSNNLPTTTQPVQTLPLSALPTLPLPGAAPSNMPGVRPPVRKATTLPGTFPSNQECIARHCSNNSEPNSQYCSQCLCKQCKRSPRNIGFDFCGRTCGAAWSRTQGDPSVPCTRGVRSTTLPVGQSIPECELPDCHRPVWQDPSGHFSRWCGRSHKAIAEKQATPSKDICLQCKAAPVKAGWLFCGAACEKDAHTDAPQLIEVPSSYEAYASVKRQFEEKWQHNTKTPEVKHIYKICCDQRILDRYTKYRDSVESARNLAGQKPNANCSQLMTAGNEQRRWHGTSRICKLGDNGETKCCLDSKCSLCSIVRTSFDVGRWASNTKWGRFGKGIYVSATASKANDYARNANGFSQTKAVLLNKVVVGRGCKLKANDDTLTEPPKGYDSVLGETGYDLNHDEVVVYKNEAIRPSYLVIYEKTDKSF